MRCFVVLLLAGAVFADADQVLAAFKAGDATALRTLAEKDEPDPWLVADELCARGEFAAAAAFAGASPREDLKRLPAYVAAQRASPVPKAWRDAVAAAKAAGEAKDADALEKAIRSVEAAGTSVVAVRLLLARGLAHQLKREFAKGAKAFRAAADLARDLGWRQGRSKALSRCAANHFWAEDARAALQVWEERAELEQTRGRPVADILGNLGAGYYRLGEFERACGFLERAYPEQLKLGQSADAARTLTNLGVVRRRIGDLERAIAAFTQAAEIREAAGDRATALELRMTTGLLWKRRGDTAAAIGSFERAVEHARALGQPDNEAGVLVNMASVLTDVARYDASRAALERALELGEAPLVRANARINLGVLHRALGDVAAAIEAQKEALAIAERIPDAQTMARALGNLGAIHDEMGDDAAARGYLERALALMERVGDRAGVAQTLMLLGNIRTRSGDRNGAVEQLQRALREYTQLKDGPGRAKTLTSLAVLHARLGELDEAEPLLREALALQRRIGDRVGSAETLTTLAGVQTRRKQYDAAAATLSEAIEAAREAGDVRTEVASLWILAACAYEQGRDAEAVRVAREGIARLPLLVGGLAEEEGATARGQWAGLMDVGVKAGLRLDDPAAMSFFIESGRAGSLLESLGGRAAIGDVQLPKELVAEEAAARAAIRATRLRIAGLRQRKAIRSARTDLEQAQARLLDVVARIRRVAKAAADVRYPEAAGLPEIQAALADDAALVSYVDLIGNQAALVVTRDAARLVFVGAVEVPDLGNAKAAFEPGPLREALIEPLGLTAKTKRLLISPTGVLSRVPFAALVPDREVVYVASGTTYRTLRAERGGRGAGVLALGDPEVAGLPPLPATRAEAGAVGDEVLLGADASAAKLRDALRARPRWRAVHFACHGVVDAARPRLSSLALSDGPLTTVEVFRLRIPADLAVLSACETGRGKVYKAEGVVGLTRAFMLAGSPRVIVSLWKVDDQATRALMTKFYALWKPGKMPTATALRKAQEFVRSHEPWAHPYYWAAWQLWGLPD